MTRGTLKKLLIPNKMFEMKTCLICSGSSCSSRSSAASKRNHSLFQAGLSDFL